MFEIYQYHNILAVLLSLVSFEKKRVYKMTLYFRAQPDHIVVDKARQMDGYIGTVQLGTPMSIHS